jgi:hypothetical protein
MPSAKPLALALALVGLAQPSIAEPEDPLPGFELDQAITCLAFAITEIELDEEGSTAAARADWIVFFSGLIAAKSAKADADAIGDRFADELVFLRNPSYEEGVAATPDEVDEIRTGVGKMCWFEALAAEGGPYEGE